MTLTEAAMTERLDRRGLLAAAHGPGCYALRCPVPDDPDAVTAAFRAVSDADAPDGYAERLAGADRVAYLGASGEVYERLCDHAGADVRKATFLRAFPPVEVVNVWPREEPFGYEHRHAYRMARDGWTVWSDGQLYG